MIPYYVPFIKCKEIKAANRVLRSGWLAQGDEVKKLEEEYSEYCGGDYCVAVSSATAGLYLACKYMKNYHGWNSINIPAYTFTATWQSAKAAGLNINICDIREDYDFFEKGNEIQVAFAGRKIICFPAHETIVDTAHCFPFISDNTKVFSFYPTKPIASNGGGMIVTKDKDLADWCRLMRQHGRNEAVGHAENPASIGFNFWMSDLNAAIARTQLKKIECLKNERKRIVNKYLEYLKDYDIYYGDHLIMLRLPNWYHREKIQDAFEKANIGFSRPYIPLASKEQAPNAWALYEKSISLPYYVELKNSQIKCICDTIKGAVK